MPILIELQSLTTSGSEGEGMDDEFKRERQQEGEYLLKFISRLRDEQVAWDKEQAKLPNEQRTERNVFDEYVRHQRRVAKQKMRSLLEDFQSPSNGGKGHQTPEE
ncbi:hypothetical protein KC345_g2972 [Hortaea werneckii]|nr:hypothetical protein KC345_g2972 [Hortaea werneckii]